MEFAGYFQILFLVSLIILFSAILGEYMGRIYLGKRSALDPLFHPLENGLYRFMGINPMEEMGWKEYLSALLLLNLFFGMLTFSILLFQGILPLNPDRIPSLPPLLDFNSVVSFLTNTDIQHYTGELQLSYLSQMAFATFLMFVSAATGMCAAVALIRGLINQNGKLGNFYRDFVVTITRILLPVSLIEAFVFVYLGVPQTLSGAVVAHTIFMGNQTIFRGPVATLESIKFFGGNGGGFYGADSAFPFENPGPVANYIQLVTEAAIPFGLIIAFGHMVRNQRQARMLVAVTMSFFLIGLGLALYGETLPNPHLLSLPILQSAGNWAGKDSRFSIVESTFSLVLNTYTQTGGPTVTLNQANPLSQMVALFGMEVQGTPGGVGTGLISLLIYVILAVFVSGLMVGRTPEYLGKKISSGVMRSSVVFVLIHPVIILVPLSVTVISGMARLVPLPPHEAFTGLLYEFTSAAANNGSSFTGLLSPANQSFVLATESIVMLAGRYLPIALALSIAGSFSVTKPLTQIRSASMTEDPVFAVFLFGFIAILGALLFLPVLVLGPLSAFLGG